MINYALKYMRIKNNIKQEELAKKLNVKSNTISQYETSNRQPTFETIEKIADICDYDIYFIDRKTNKKFKCNELIRKI